LLPFVAKELNADRDSRVPRLLEGHAIDLTEEINPIGRAPKLHHDAWFDQFLHGLDARNRAGPKLKQRREKPGCIGGGGFVKEINVAGEPRVAVINNCLSPDDHTAHLEAAQQSHEFDDIG